MTAPAAIVLDLDGVILESESAKSDAFREAFAEYPQHMEAMVAFHAAHPSLPRRRKFERLAELLGRAGDAALVDELVASFSERVLELVAAAPFVPGAEAFLAEFSRRAPLYVASVTPESDLREILARKGIADRFVRAFGDPPTSKEDALRAVVAAHGGDGAAIVLIGDAPADLAAARATGVGFIGRRGSIAFPAPAPPLHADLAAIAALLRPRFPARPAPAAR